MISTQELRRYPNFAGFTEKQLTQIAMIARKRTFEVGERLFEEGSTATHFMLLKEGRINIVYRIGDGSDVIADTLTAGDPLAWSALLEPHKLTASGVAIKGGTLIEIDAGGLRRICEENSDLGYTIMKEIAKTLRTRLSAMRVKAASNVAETA